MESEIHVQPAKDYINDLFTNVPDDRRFSRVTYEKFLPVTSVKNYRDLQADPAINFHLPKKTAPYVYLLSQALVSVKVKIVDSNGALPAKSGRVCMVNNILHSMFSSVEVKLNLTPISACNMYNYKAYLQTVLTYGRSTARCPLECAGYYPDLAKQFDDFVANPGHVNRTTIFKKECSSSGEYATNGCEFTGRILHELVSTQKFIPPEWQIDFTFVRAKDEFVLFQDLSDQTKYKIYLQDIVLYIPVGTLTTQCLSYLNTRFPRQPIPYNFRKLIVTQHNVYKTKSYHCMNILGTNSGIYPTRVFIVFIENGRREGHVNKNPYLFARSWKYTATTDFSGLDHHKHLLEQSYIDKLQTGFLGYLQREKLKKRLKKERRRQKKAEEKLKSSMPKEVLPSTSAAPLQRKGRGKKKVSTEDADYVPEDSSSSTDSSDLLQSDENSDILIIKGFDKPTSRSPSESGAFHDARSSTSVQAEEVGLKTEKQVSIESIRLLVQGSPIDNLESSQASNSATNDFIRLFKTCSMMNSTYSNGHEN